MKFRNLTILAVLALLLVSGAPLVAQDATSVTVTNMLGRRVKLPAPAQVGQIYRGPPTSGPIMSCRPR
jgi:hypothetical protein